MCVRGFFLILFFFAPRANAQIDFTSHFLSSGKYKIKTESRSKSRGPASADSAAAGEKKPELPASSAPADEPGWREQARGLWTGDQDRIDKFYQEKIEGDDSRLNRVEIQFLSGLSDLASRSPSSTRRYRMSSADLKLRSNVWFTPLLGLSGAVRFSLGGAVAANDSSQSTDPVRNEEMEIGIKLRRYFGVSKLAPSVVFNVYYMDEDFRVSADSTTRLRTESSGFGLGVQGSMPSSRHHTWIFGGFLEPRLAHREKETKLNANSGDPAESLGIGFEVGGEWKFDRTSQLLYGLGYRAEKNVFDGPASQADPLTGVTPSNVTATSTRLTFSLGYRWGH
ncbi:MAG TPA: hypothetical protein PL182_12255 [Pseudobdellovibrionaceae bacterium]|mgnify:CR=1 FL=1|nr:hypothetical protein [Pseudobdellovibrionaceae bacterium]